MPLDTFSSRLFGDVTMIVLSVYSFCRIHGLISEWKVNIALLLLEWTYERVPCSSRLVCVEIEPTATRMAGHSSISNSWFGAR